MHAVAIFSFLLMAGFQRQVSSQVRTDLFTDMIYVVDGHFDEEINMTNSDVSNYTLTDKSTFDLQKLVQYEKNNIIYMKLLFPSDAIFPETSYQEILQMDRWIWIRNAAGVKLLKVDFRFEFFSLGTLSSDVEHVTLNFTTICDPKQCGVEKIESPHQMRSVLQHSLGMYIPVNSSLCYHKLANSMDNYYAQPTCCSNELFPHCGHFVELHPNDWFVFTVYVLVFSLSPLLLTVFITKPKEIYTLRRNGILRRKQSFAKKMLRTLNIQKNDNEWDEEVDFPNYVKKRADDEQRAVDKTRTGLKRAANKDTSSSEQLSPIELLCSPPAVSTGKADVCCGIKYIMYNKDTPVRLTHPFKFLLLLNIDNVVLGVIRRLLFFVLFYPIIIHVYLLVVHIKYSEHVMFLTDVETKMNITGHLLELFFFDHLYAGTVFSNPYLIFWTLSMVAYGITATIFSTGVPLFILMDRLSVDDGYMGFIKLPTRLRQKSRYDPDTQKLQRKMVHRLSLMIDPQFWCFWFKELVALFRCHERCGVKESLVRILLFFGYIMSLLSFLPLVNCLPFDIIARALRQPEESETRQLVKKYGRQQLAQLIAIIFAVTMSLWGLLFAIFIFMESSRIVGLIIIYTVRGVIRNYIQIIPIVSIILAGWHFLQTTLSNVEKQYLSYKKIIFDACIQEDDRLKSKFSPDEKLLQFPAYPLVVYRRDGIPLIPRDLYYKVLFNLFPLGKHELPAIGKLLFTAGFLHLVATTVGVFSEDSITSLGEALTTLLAATIPNFLQAVFKFDQDPITTDSHNFKVHKEIRRLYLLNGQVTSELEHKVVEPAAEDLGTESQNEETKTAAQTEDVELTAV